MGAITLGGKACSSAFITCPRRGRWTADVSLHGAEMLSGTLDLVIGKRTMRGTVVPGRAAVYGGTTSLRLVGGYYGWQKKLPAKSYSHNPGVRKSNVINDAAREAGEKLGPYPDATIGALWIRENGATAENVLELLVNGEWFIDDAGVTQLAARPTGRISSAYSVTTRSPDSARVEIATEVFEDWLPGRSFISPTTPDEQTISLVTINANDGTSPRVSVLTGPSAEERMLDSFRSIVRQELSEIFYAGLWSYTILSSSNGKIDAKPNSTRVPPIKDCPMLPGLMGEVVDPKPGTTCYVLFADLNPGKPFVAHIDGVAMTTTIAAITELAINGAVIRINEGNQPVARLGDTVAGIFAITSGNPRILG